MGGRCRSTPATGRPSGATTELEQLEAALDALAEEARSASRSRASRGSARRACSPSCAAAPRSAAASCSPGSATEFERDLPFSVWVDALDAYVASQELSLDEAWDAELGRRARGDPPVAARPARPAAASVADERYRAHRAVRRLLELLAADRPLVLVLDDLHWSDGASIELLGALLRRGPDAPVLLALAFRRGQAPARLVGRARGAVGAADRARAAQRGGGGASCSATSTRRSAAAIYRHGGGNPFYLEQLARAGEATVAPRSAAAASVDAAGVPRGRRRVAGRGARVAVAGRARAARGRGRRRRAVRARPRGGDRRAVRPPRARRARRAARPRPRAPDRGAAPLRLPPPARAPRGLRVGAAAAGGSPRTRARPRRSRRAGAAAGRARAPRRAVGRAGRRGGDRAAARGGRRGGGARAGRRGALVRGRAAAAAARRRGRARSTSASALASALRAARRARALPRDAARGDRAAAGRRARAARRADGAVRGGRALARPPRRGAPAPRARVGGAARPHRPRPRPRCRSSWRSTGSTSSTSSRRRRWAAARWRRRGRSATARSIAAAASALCLGETAAGRIDAAREHREEARAEVDRLSDDELAPRLEALYYLGWAETYLERYDDAVAHFERGIAIARATGDGRLLVPMMLGKNFPFEMQGRLAEAIELLRDGARGGAALGEPARALLGAVRAGLGALLRRRPRRRDRGVRGERARRSPPGRRRRSRTRGGGPGWGLGVAWFEPARSSAARAILLELGGDDVARTIPVERCFDWESLALVELARRERSRRPTAYARRAEEDAARLGLQLPAALAGRARAAVLLAARRAGRGGARRPSARPRPPTAIGARLQAAFSRSLAGPRARRRGRAHGGDRGAARGRERARRVRLGARARRDAPRAAQARRARRVARAGDRGRERASRR